MEMMIAHECQHRIPDLLFATFEPLSRRIGIEVSYPFLNPDVVALTTALDVDSRYRTDAGRFSLCVSELQPGYKHAFRLIAQHKVPELVYNRPRKAFTAPFGAWLLDKNFSGALYARLAQSRFWSLGIIERPWLDRAFARSRPRATNPWQHQLWAMLTLVSWYDRFVDPRS